MNAPQPMQGMPAPPAVAQDLRELRRGVSQAADAQVLRVVRMVDALQDRGATDAVLDPVRPRLRAMHLARPLRFARLLFMPADPLIVPPKTWRSGSPLVPRTALMVLARAVRSLMASAPSSLDYLDRIDALIGSADTTHTALIRQAGQLLWPQASIALRALGGAGPAGASAVLSECIEAWANEGLPRTELQPTALALAPIFDVALALHDHEQGACSLSEAALLDMVAAVEPAGPRACSMMLSLLLIRTPEHGPALLAAAQRLVTLRPVASSAAETALDWVEAETEDQTASVDDAAALDLVRQAALLDTLSGLPGDTGRRRRLVEAKARLRNGSLNRFGASLKDKMADPLAALPAEPAERDAALDSLEQAARTLRRFEVEARRLGDSAKFDALLSDAGQRVADADGLSLMDRARLMEIIAGPEAAARLLAGAGDGSTESLHF